MTNSIETKSMKFSEIKSIYSELDDLNIDDKRTVLENMLNNDSDFEVENYRFIHKDDIDTIQQDEMKSDPYMLGCFNAWFIADNTDLDIDIVEALQSADKYTELGNHILNNGYLEDMQSAYTSADGYGHHFNSYDGSENEIGDYYAFRIN